ncbi:biotin--[acetyl-CoA-carboxylase] ligase [Proteiniclasticum sp. C24MP]|uniref:biotin--[acetyl-CoA-carboxylase] ligase n=1 Tax=Proteiniclasticum sp. C24MP TaxID=3374101 RepID=UPI003753F327
MSKDKILTLLEEHKGKILSGNDLSSKLGISRNAIWKSVNALRKEGHQITSIRNRGYVLELGSDHLSESEIRMHLGESSSTHNILILTETPSTNTYIKEHKDLPDNTVVLSNTQTSGRGRLGKTFHSQDQGGIYLSLLKVKELTKYDTDLATLAAAVATAETLDKVCGTETAIKWVNDLYLNGLKVSGILTEGTIEFESGTLSSLIIGIGINVNTERFPEELEDIATSLYQVTGKKSVRSEIIGHLLRSLEEHLRMTKDNPEELLRKYKKRMLYLGEEITIHRGNEIAYGKLMDLSRKGHLIIESEGKTLTLNSGEISIRKREIRNE